MKKKKLVIDADGLLFQVAEGSYTQDNLFANESLKAYKQRFKDLVSGIEDEVSVALLGKVKLKGKTKVSLSDPKSNFRYDIYPAYKANREDGSRSDLFYQLRKWALKYYGYVKHIEADDEVAYYVRKGYIGASFDKDLLKGVAGLWFDTYHSRRSITETSELEAQRFNMCQVLMGDPTDNILALPKVAGNPMIDGVPTKGVRKPFKVTEKIAIQLLDEYGWDWNGVIKAYEAKGFTEKEAILNKRLVSMIHWTPKKGIKLWKPQKSLPKS